MYILVVAFSSSYRQAIRKARPVSTSPRRPPPTRVLGAAPAFGAAVLLLAAAVLVSVLVGASLVDVVVLGAGEDVTVAVLRVLGRMEVSVIRLVGMAEDFSPAIALDCAEARTLEADAKDAEAADWTAET